MRTKALDGARSQSIVRRKSSRCRNIGAVGGIAEVVSQEVTQARPPTDKQGFTEASAADDIFSNIGRKISFPLRRGIWRGQNISGLAARIASTQVSSREC